MKLSNYFDKKLIFIDIEGNTQEEIIEKLVEKIASEDRVVADKKEEIKGSNKKRKRDFNSNRNGSGSSSC